MIKKNWLSMVRNRRATTVQIVVPIILTLLLYLVAYALENSRGRGEFLASTSHSSTETVNPIGECVSHYQDFCYTMAYTPASDLVVQDLVTKITTRNGFTKTRGFSSELDFSKWALSNYNATQAAVHFQVQYSVNPPTDPLNQIASISYALQFNSTLARYRGAWVKPLYAIELPYVTAVDTAILELANERNTPSASFAYEPYMMAYPHPKLSPTDMIGEIGPMFFFGALMFNIIMQLNALVQEREMHLRQSMHQMGLSVSAYWLSYAVVNFVLNLVSALLLIATGAACQFDFFLKTHFPVYFILFALFALVLVPFVFFLSVFVSKARTGTVLGFAMFLIGTLVQSMVDLIFKDSVNVGIRIIFIIQPWALLSKGMSDIGRWAGVAGGLQWDNIKESSDFMPVSDIYLLLLLDSAIFAVVAIYLDQVIPDDKGISQPLYFCCLPRFWCPSGERVLGSKEAPSGNKRVRKQNADANAGTFADAGAGAQMDEFKDGDASAGGALTSAMGGDAASHGIAATVEEQLNLTRAGEDPDVVAEAKKVREAVDVNYPVRLDQLGITFYARKCLCLRDPDRDFQAVREMNLLLDKNSLFCLLGHNGAGKSTTINMLTGLLYPTAGEARVMGYSIRTGMHEIKKFMGVCPQHDVLWNELTAREHLELFAAFKGVPADRVKEEVDQRLKDVDLFRYGSALAGKFSGGMKRRLSVAIALIGDPAIVYLDEPTTGMDSISRRQVWDLIEKVKYNRVTVLTTHSMEEADALGDRIGIMKEGRFICMGSSVRLKNKFGTGYRVTVVIDAATPPAQRRAQLRAIHEFFVKHLPSVEIDSRESNSIRFKVPRSASRDLITFFGQLEAAQADLRILDMQLSLTTLEEVFLAVGAIGEDHSDTRFGVSSQVGTELSKALKRLEEIRTIQARRQLAFEAGAGSAQAADYARQEALQEALGVDNSPEALAEELPQLEEIEAVALRLEQLRNGFESNKYLAYSQGNVEQRTHWDHRRAHHEHLRLNEHTVLPPPPGVNLASPAGAHGTAVVAPAKGASAPALTHDAHGKPPVPASVGRNGASVLDTYGNDSGAHAHAADAHGSSTTLVRRGPGGAARAQGKRSGAAKMLLEDGDDDLELPPLSAEMAQEQELAFKEYLKKRLIHKNRQCCGGFRRTWRKWSCCKKFGFVFLWIVILIIVIVIIASIVNNANKKSNKTPLLEVPQFAGSPALADLTAGTWNEIIPGSTTTCARGDPFSYFVWVPPVGTNPDKNMLFHLGGGNPCWDAATCDSLDATFDYSVTVDITRNSFKAQNLTGIFEHTTQNPMQDYLHVYVPLCTADAHLGAADVIHTGGMTIHHQGAVNAQAALTWLQTAYLPTDPAFTIAGSNIVVAGARSGGYGAALWAFPIAAAYPNAYIVTLTDTAFDAVTAGTAFAGLPPSALGPESTSSYATYLNNVMGGWFGKVAETWGLYSAPVFTFPGATLTAAGLRANPHIEYVHAQFMTAYGLRARVLRPQVFASASTLLWARRVLVGAGAETTSQRQNSPALPDPTYVNVLAIDRDYQQDPQFDTEPGAITAAQLGAGRAALARSLCLALQDCNAAVAGGTLTASTFSVAGAEADSVIESPLMFESPSLDGTTTFLLWLDNALSSRTNINNTPGTFTC